MKPKRGLNRNAPPLDKGGRASLLLDLPADKVALLVKVVVDQAVDGNEFLRCFLFHRN
ncbi:hypothetical protein GCM10007874_00370 [Labrys miyagiensis]|uniref:Uncharacterized protein n=1 Tax=Labrys miyagiensis TaxID=346912 RepID=A0ABQ6CFL8_9HYPH|nr:hypothetical protein GCM10007874_00370 [Labrys miyagiensis]